jgi:hypothetical protein
VAADRLLVTDLMTFREEDVADRFAMPLVCR